MTIYVPVSSVTPEFINQLNANFSTLAAAEVPNLATLKATQYAPAVVNVGCKTTVGDGWGGSFAFDAGDTTTPGDDALVVVDNAGRRWKRVSSKYLYINTDDADALPWVTSMSGTGILATEGNSNGLIAVVVNNLGAAAVSFPTAVTGIAIQKGDGNVAFSAYLENVLKAAGSVTAEFAAFQKSAPAPTAYPFNDALGTTQHIAKALQLTAGTQSVAFTGDTASGGTTISNVVGYLLPATVGSVITGTGLARNTRVTVVGAGTLTISKAATANGTGVALTAVSAAATALDFLREGSTNGVFNFGMTSRAGAILGHIGYFDATATLGADNGIFLALPGDVVGNSHLILKTMSAGVAANKVIDVQNSSGTTLASIRQDGKVNASTLQIAGVDFATMSGTYSLFKAGDGSTVITAGGSGDQSTYYDNTQHVFRSIAGGATFATFDTNGLTMASGKALKLGNAYQAGAPAATGYVTMKDSAGTTIKVLVSNV